MHEVASQSSYFGQQLKQHRKNLDLTQEELAERIGCSVIAIRKIEAGMRRPSKQVADIMAELFSVPEDQREVFITFARGKTDGLERSSERSGAERGTRGNLPSRLFRLIGREEAAANVASRLLHEEVRLLTLIGPPGIGKTSLALHVASAHLSNFRDGVFFVPLAPVVEPSMVTAAIAKVFGLPDSSHRQMEEVLTDLLQAKEMLLLLDNFEQVVEAAPTIVSILERCPHLKVMVTSREPLHVRGEHLFRVLPLQLPDLRHGHQVDTIMRSPAVTLFTERAASCEPYFALTEQNAEAVAAICVRLEGLPLAIELAAARIRMFTPEEIESHLDSSLQLLSGGPRDLPARQRTLRSAIDWSYALLSEGEQQLFARLGVFSGGCTLSSAEAICNEHGDLPFSTLEGLLSLLDKSLLKREEREGETRFTMLETIREFALERLEEHGKADHIRHLHAEYYLVLVEASEEGLSGPAQAQLLDLLEAEHDNMRASLRWAREKGRGSSTEARRALDIGLRIGGAARHFWLLRGYFSQGRNELQELVSLSPPHSTLTHYSKSAKAKALGGLGRLAYRQGDYSAACLHFKGSLTLRREVGDKPGVAWSLTHLAMAKLQQMVISGEEDYSTPRSLQEEGLRFHQELGDIWNIALSLEQLGILAYLEGDYSRATSLFEESLALHKEQGQESSIGTLLYQLGIVAHLTREYERARLLFRESLTRQIKIGYKLGIALGVAALGEVSVLSEEPERGAVLMGASDALYKSIVGVMDPCDRLVFERALALVRSQLGEAEFEKRWQEGRIMSAEEAISYALEQ